jgi:hypothetical protein
LTMFQNQRTELGRAPCRFLNQIELELKRLELCMAKPWYRLAMIEHQKVGWALHFSLADTTYHNVDQYIMGMGGML